MFTPSAVRPAPLGNLPYLDEFDNKAQGKILRKNLPIPISKPPPIIEKLLPTKLFLFIVRKLEPELVLAYGTLNSSLRCLLFENNSPKPVKIRIYKEICFFGDVSC
ncbi:MAG: hypothetical protein ACYDCN_14895 [Bacteroidia bacterium]